MTEFAEAVKLSFSKQPAMHLIRATLARVEHGRVEIEIPHWHDVEQQHGYVHGGIIGMIADSAAGYAAMTMAPEGASVLTVEYKVNLMAPALGEKIVARGAVVRAGRTLIITRADVFSVTGSDETLCAIMQQTVMVMAGKPEKKRD